MEPTGSNKPLVLMLAEAPGKVEDEKNEQMVGDSGKFLRPLIPNYFRDKVAWDNIIRCRPPKNRDPEKIEVECCRPRHISYIEQIKPKAIFGFGNVPLEWVINQTGISKWRGRRIPVKIGNHECWYYPMFHPSFLIRNGDNNTKSTNQDKINNKVAFEFDLKRAFGEVYKDNLPSPIIHTTKETKDDIVCITGKEPNALKTVLNFLKFASQKEYSGLDYETQNLRPYLEDSRILTIAVSTLEQTLAFGLNHPQVGWSKREKEVLNEAYVDYLL